MSPREARDAGQEHRVEQARVVLEDAVKVLQFPDRGLRVMVGANVLHKGTIYLTGRGA